VPLTHATTGFLSSPAPLYFDRLTPADARGDPLVLVHGGAHSGACYRRTPDGRPGWASDFLGQGFDVLVVDWPGQGRSGHVPPERIRGELIVTVLRQLLEQLDRPVTVLVRAFMPVDAPVLPALCKQAKGAREITTKIVSVWSTGDSSERRRAERSRNARGKVPIFGRSAV